MTERSERSRSFAEGGLALRSVVLTTVALLARFIRLLWARSNPVAFPEAEKAVVQLSGASVSLSDGVVDVALGCPVVASAVRTFDSPALVDVGRVSRVTIGGVGSSTVGGTPRVRPALWAGSSRVSGSRGGACERQGEVTSLESQQLGSKAIQQLAERCFGRVSSDLFVDLFANRGMQFRCEGLPPERVAVLLSSPICCISSTRWLASS